MQAGLQAIKANGTWSLTTLPPAKRVVGCKWIYKLKFGANGTLECHKAHLVAKANKSLIVTNLATGGNVST